jgi:uncharacterized protein
MPQPNKIDAGDRECRTLATGTVEARAATDNTGKADMIVGYAAKYNEPTSIGDFFVEVIAPGAFTDAIAKDDVRAVFNHDENLVLGRNKAGTLRLFEDAIGLRYEIDPPDTQFARDLIESMRRGDVSQSSFAFTMRGGAESWDETGAVPKRTITKIGSLFDVSPVTYPAYDNTEAGLRSRDAARAEKPGEQSQTFDGLGFLRRLEKDLALRAK